MVSLGAVERTSVTEAVHDQLLSLIMSGHVKVGDKLPSEAELARSFAVSRPVVREALGGLRAVGLVSPRNGRGTFVTSLEPPGLLLLGRYSARDLHEVRCHLEIPGAGRAAERASDDDLRRLRKILVSQARTSDANEWVRLDIAFHVSLAAATENAVHKELVEHLRALRFQQSFSIASYPGRLTRSYEEHEKILSAVERHDRQGAETAMATHLETVNRLLSGLETTTNS